MRTDVLVFRSPWGLRVGYSLGAVAIAACAVWGAVFDDLPPILLVAGLGCSIFTELQNRCQRVVVDMALGEVRVISVIRHWELPITAVRKVGFPLWGHVTLVVEHPEGSRSRRIPTGITGTRSTRPVTLELAARIGVPVESPIRAMRRDVVPAPAPLPLLDQPPGWWRRAASTFRRP